MIKQIINKAIAGCVSLSIILSSINIAAASENPIVAFPGAEGGGMYSQGARAADNIEIYHVTNLNDSGIGSFRDGVSKGNRIIVFYVAGNIMLESDLYIKSSNLTILGQTAPGEGICVAGESVRFGNCSNVILRYMKFRMGDNSVSEEDGLGVRRSKDFIIDHCSIEWSVDECLSAYENKNFTAQYCIISESLNNSVHGKGEHGYGGIWGGINASFHHNLISTHKARMPRIGSSETVSTFEGAPDTDSLIDIRNNVFYNYRSTIGYGGENGTRVNFVNNYYKPSAFSSSNVRFYTAYGTRGTTLYLEGNYMEGNDTFNNDNWTLTSTDEDLKLKSISDGIMVDGILKANDEYIYDYPVKTVSAKETYEDVIENAGACVVRDYTDTRIVRDVINGTYPTGSNGSVGLIDTQNDVGGWNGLYGNKDSDRDNDGIPDEWETANGLNPDVFDSTQISDNGYTNIENYANDIVLNNYNLTDKNSLWEVMNKVEKLNSKDYFPELWSNVETAFEKGKNVRANINSLQNDIDEAAEELNNAFNNLQEDKRTVLTKAISDAVKLDKNKYTANSWNLLNSEVENGKIVLTEEYNEENVLKAAENINKAIDCLAVSNRVSLLEAIEKYSNYDNDEWTRESYSNLKKEIVNAESIYNDFNYSEEGYISEINVIENLFDLLEPVYKAESEILDFEDFKTGEYGDNYTYKNFKFCSSIYPQGNKFNIIDYNGNKVYMAKSNSTITRQYDEILQGVYSAEGDFMMTEPKNSYKIMELWNNGTTISLNSTGEMNLILGYDKYYLTTPAAGKWYNIKAVVDTDNKIVSVFIDGKLIQENITIGEKNISGFSFANNSLRTGELYCDNIKITKRIYPEILFGDANGDGVLTVTDVEMVLQKVQNFEYNMPLQDITDNYMYYIDVDGNGILTSSDAAYVLQKVLNSSFVMPAETETISESTTEYTTEDYTESTTEINTPISYELNFDNIPLGSYDGLYDAESGFSVNNIDKGLVNVVERPINYNGINYTNAIDGNSNEISFTVNDNVMLQIIGSTKGFGGQFHIAGQLADGTSFENRRYAEPDIGDSEYSQCSTIFSLSKGSYTLDCPNIMVNYIRMYN